MLNLMSLPQENPTTDTHQLVKNEDRIATEHEF